MIIGWFCMLFIKEMIMEEVIVVGIFFIFEVFIIVFLDVVILVVDIIVEFVIEGVKGVEDIIVMVFIFVIIGNGNNVGYLYFVFFYIGLFFNVFF